MWWFVCALLVVVLVTNFVIYPSLHQYFFEENEQTPGPSHFLNTATNGGTGPAYPQSIESIDLKDEENVYHYLSRRWHGFAPTDYAHMKQIIASYAKFHTAIVHHDSNSGASTPLKGKYIILHPAAQMCNRLRAHMGTIYLVQEVQGVQKKCRGVLFFFYYLSKKKKKKRIPILHKYICNNIGILTRRIVLIDIGAENYAARLDGVFKNPGFCWEYQKIADTLRSKLEKASTKQLAFPYETEMGYEQIICNRWLSDTTPVWNLNSHAAFLPLIARNVHLHEEVTKRYASAATFDDNSKEEPFDLWLVQWFPVTPNKTGSISRTGGQEQMEILEVLLARALYVIDSHVQKRVDELIATTYANAARFYSQINVTLEQGEVPWVVGLHMRSEYLLSMNLEKSRS
ncbi:hypothetical protein RFI_28740 [Reticulomyxa filosa]|uniref:Uncharacterized protein n=1 Tax=Reticulomyxa filosa TaxID=46433 RepID=X6M3U3_RETFI|nr:hypothetical protein RFI_28740 [Reticulomyxa filosa]|eukprot:ETO08648.1 hypothetical protein RFI_28740 [Reticulomyxa filosa]